MIKLKPLLFEVHATRSDMKNPIFMGGVKQAVEDKKTGQKRSSVFFKEMPPDFVRGYKFVLQDDGGNTDWWAKANDKLTDLVAMFGRSYGNRL